MKLTYSLTVLSSVSSFNPKYLLVKCFKDVCIANRDANSQRRCMNPHANVNLALHFRVITSVYWQHVSNDYFFRTILVDNSMTSRLLHFQNMIRVILAWKIILILISFPGIILRGYETHQSSNNAESLVNRQGFDITLLKKSVISISIYLIH